VTVTYGAANEIYNTLTGFTDGAASFNISLPAGTHNLTVNVTDITDNIILSNILVVADQSTFTLALDPGPYYINIPFNLLINGAKDRDNGLLNGDINVIITSNQPGEDAYNATANFVDGNAVISLTMTTPANHTLTVQVEGVTASSNIEVNVVDNVSGFNIVLAASGDKTAGIPFGLLYQMQLVCPEQP
jgi:Flp pilus assembly protein TadG